MFIATFKEIERQCGAINFGEMHDPVVERAASVRVSISNVVGFTSRCLRKQLNTTSRGSRTANTIFASGNNLAIRKRFNVLKGCLSTKICPRLGAECADALPVIIPRPIEQRLAQ